MSFYREKQKRLFLYDAVNKERYGAFFAYQSRDEICRALNAAIRPRRNMFSARSLHRVQAYKVVMDMNRILSAHEHQQVSSRTVSSVFNLMYIDGDEGRGEPGTMEIARKYTQSNRLYVERRYWDQAATQAFCIAARLSEAEAGKILGPMMGQPWLYLRDPYSLVTDYALNRGLNAAQTVELLTYTNDVTAWKTREHTDESLTREDPEALTIRVGRSYTEKLKNQPIDTPELAMERFRAFVREEADILVGTFARTLSVMQNLICFRGWEEMEIENDCDFEFYFMKAGRSEEKYNLKHLAEHMAQTFVPWEAKGRKEDTAQRKWNLLTTGADKHAVIYERLRSYMKPMKEQTIRYGEMRLDLLRLLLIYRVTDITFINRCLRNLSFSELNPLLPFDFFVLAAIAYGTGPRTNDCDADPYRVLTELMAYYAAVMEEEA